MARTALVGLAAGVYLRETHRSNRDGPMVRYLQLALNERHRETGVPTAKVIHNCGRVEKVDQAVLARSVPSVARGSSLRSMDLRSAWVRVNRGCARVDAGRSVVPASPS